MGLLTATESIQKWWDIIQVQHAVNPHCRKTLDGIQISWALKYNLKLELLATLFFGTVGISHVFLTRNCNEQRCSSLERKRDDMLARSILVPLEMRSPASQNIPQPIVWCLKSPLPYNPQYTGMGLHIHVRNSVVLPLFNILGTKTRNKFVPWNKVEARLEKKFELSNSQSSILTMNNNSYSIVRKQYIKPWWYDIFQWWGGRISSGPETSFW